jgi:hypothetical protein
VGKPSKVGISRLLSATDFEQWSSRVGMSPNFGMAIGKVEAITEFMPMFGISREIDPHIRRGIRNKEPVVNASLVLIQENPQFGWPLNVGFLREKRNKVVGGFRDRRRCRIAGSHEAVHGVAADGGDLDLAKGMIRVGGAVKIETL